MTEQTVNADTKRRWKLGVEFDNGYSNRYPKTYHYQLCQDEPIPEVGDKAVVIVSDEYKMVTVVSVEEVTGSLEDIGWKFVHSLLSYSHIRREKEREIQRMVLRDEINKLKRKHVEQMELNALAEAIPEAAELINKLKALG